MMSGRDIVLLSSIEWDLLWQEQQEVSVRLARAGNRVLYVENTGIRGPAMRDAPRVLRRLASWLRAVRSRGLRDAAPGLYVCAPIVLPPFGSVLSSALNRLVFLRAIRRHARRLGFRDPLIWTYLPTDTVLSAIDLLASEGSLVVYACIADFAVLAPRVEPLERAERALLERSDVVFARPTLAEHCGRSARNVHPVPPGVDLALFEARVAGVGTISRLSRPVVGYVGGLHRFVDVGLLSELARARPEWSWALVGPEQEDVGGLAEHPNVHLLGHVPHSGLPALIQGFDVALVPYTEEAFTTTVMPTKAGEYLAMGKPVVSTRIPAMVELERATGAVTVAAPARDAFLAAIEEALAEAGDPAAAERRRAVAATYDWGGQLERMSAVIESCAERPERA